MFQSWKILWLRVEANPELATFVRHYMLTYGAPPESHCTVTSRGGSCFSSCGNIGSQMNKIF